MSPVDTTPVVATDPRGLPTTLLVAGEGTFATHTLHPGEVLIGRGDGCAIRVDHKALSRQHAVLQVGAVTTIRDLGSTNGTRVGGDLHRGGAAVTLAANDSFHIGPFSFVLLGATAATLRSLSGRDILRVDDPSSDAVAPLIRDIARAPASVLILGETGVGKEVLAGTLHALSERTGEFTRINCAALSESLLESELFGHEKGAFTGATVARAGLLEAAEGGTVFLDEVGELPPAIQAKLLRAVEAREVLRLGSTRPRTIDVRFVAATNRDLASEVEAGRFRRDLYFRLDGVTLMIPPLRERRGMIGPLALRFVERAGAGTGQRRLAGEVLAALEAYPWPGNVRELKAVVERALLLARGGDVGVRHLAFAREPSGQVPVIAPPVAAVAAAAANAGEVPDFLDDEQRADRAAIVAALDRCAGNQTRAAEVLGIARSTLATKLRLYRIPRPRS